VDGKAQSFIAYMVPSKGLSLKICLQYTRHWRKLHKRLLQPESQKWNQRRTFLSHKNFYYWIWNQIPFLFNP